MAVEFVTDKSGRHYRYDINTNTNYNSDAEDRSGLFGMQRLAEYLGGELLNAYGSDILKQVKYNMRFWLFELSHLYFSIIVPYEHALVLLYGVLLSKLIEFVRKTYHVGIRIFFQPKCA